MSSFSRGCFLRQRFPRLDARFFRRTKSFRLLSSSLILRAVGKSGHKIALKEALPKNKPYFAPAKSTTSTPHPAYQTFASGLAQKDHRTLLYEAPSHTAFIISSYAVSGFCFTYAVVAFWSNYMNASPTLNGWVPVAFGGICFLMAGAGGYFMLGPAWIIKSITAIPFAELKAVGAIRANAPKSGAPELKIEIELRKMFPMPFFPARKMYVEPDELQLHHQLARAETRLTATEIRSLRQQEAAEGLEQNNLLRRVSRSVSKALFELFMGFRHTWTRERFTKMYIKGYQYKLDVSGGWALDGGRALDRLVTIKPRL